MECFINDSVQLEARLDPHFHRPEFKQLAAALQKLHHKKLGDVVAFANETWNQKDSFGDTFPYIEISGIDTVTGEILTIDNCDKAEAPSRAKMIVRNGDIIVSTTRPNRGAIASIDKEKDGYIASTGFAILRNLKTDDLSKEYLFYALRMPFSLNQMLQRSSGGNYPAITPEELKKIIIPAPSPSIQKNVVEIMRSAYEQKKQKEQGAEKLLNSVDDCILKDLGIRLPEAKNQQCYVVEAKDVRERLDPYYYQPRFKLFDSALTKGTFAVKSGRDFFELIESGKGVKPELINTEGIPYIEVKNIQPFKITQTESFVPREQKLKLLNFGDMITGRVGSIGSFALVDSNKETAFSDNVLQIKLKNGINDLYLLSILNSVIVRSQLEKDKKGALQGVINQQTLNGLRLPSPPTPVQKRIADEVKRRMAETEKLRNEARACIDEAKQRVEKLILGK